jgi:hypothetical protein
MRHLGFRLSAFGPRHSAFCTSALGIRHSAHGTSSPARLPPRPRSPARSHAHSQPLSGPFALHPPLVPPPPPPRSATTAATTSRSRTRSTRSAS